MSLTAAQTHALVSDVLRGIAPEADLATVGPNEDLREALDLDSMDFLNFVTALSERSGRPVPEAEARRLVTLAALAEYFAR